MVMIPNGMTPEDRANLPRYGIRYVSPHEPTSYILSKPVLQQLTVTDRGDTIEVNYWLIDSLGEAEVTTQIARETLLEHLAQEGIPNCCTSAMIDDLYDTEAYLTDNLHSVCEGYLKEGLR